MARIDQLIASYQRHVNLPLKPNLPLSQRVWFVVYAPEDERRMINRVQEFELATREAGLGWRRLDLGGAFADWIDTFGEEEREACLAEPEIVESYAETGFKEFLREQLKFWAGAVPTQEADRTVFAVTGLMEVYDFVHVSDVIDPEHLTLPGILLIFFPGERETNTYRFLGARDGWNYLAVPIVGDN
jgi:hypothetical protein